MSWTAAISGSENREVHNVRYPNAAPAIEYVTMHEGSSFAAPLITPGPNWLKTRRSHPDSCCVADFTHGKDSRQNVTLFLMLRSPS